MKYLMISTTVLFAALAVFYPHTIYASAAVTCCSYLLCGLHYFASKKYERKVQSSDPELSELYKNLEMAQLQSKIAEINRHTATQEDRFARIQKEEKTFERGVQW